MFNNIQLQINDTISEIASGKRKQSVIERVRSIEAITNISRTEHAKALSERLEVRISQQGTTLQAIDANVSRIQELMISDQSYKPENRDIVNTELTALRDEITSLLNSVNVLDDFNFGQQREQLNGNGDRIDEFSNSSTIDNIISITSDFIANKDRSLLGDIQSENDILLAELANVGLRVNELDRSQALADQRLLQYETIRSATQDADLAAAATRLSALQTQQQAAYKAYSITQGQSLFDYI